MTVYESKNSILGMEFDRYLREHPDFSEKFPNAAHVVLLTCDDEKFNEWSVNLGRKQRDAGQPVVYITIKKLAPPRSRIEELELTTA